MYWQVVTAHPLPKDLENNHAPNLLQIHLNLCLWASFVFKVCLQYLGQLKMRSVYFCGQILHLQKIKFH